MSHDDPKTDDAQIEARVAGGRVLLTIRHAIDDRKAVTQVDMSAETAIEMGKLLVILAWGLQQGAWS